MSVNVAGFYHDPPIWVGENPVESSSGSTELSVDVSDGGIESSFPFRFADEVVRATLANGLEISATLDGEFTFDFNAVPDCTYPETDTHDFPVIAEMKIRRIRFMNAFLALLYSREILTDNNSRERMLVTVNLMFTKASSAAPHAMFGPMLVSRNPKLNPVSAFIAVIGRMGFVSTGAVEGAASDLSDLIATHGDDGVMLVDLYLRATHAFQEHNHSFSLVNYWTIIERMINELWTKLQHDNETRDGQIFIDGKRRERLGDGRTYTAAVMTEILSLSGYIPKSLYDDITAVRKLRNDWMHNLKQIDADKAIKANSVCERLLQQVMGVTLRGPGGLMLRGL
jgi:hypothetical protein